MQVFCKKLIDDYQKEECGDMEDYPRITRWLMDYINNVITKDEISEIFNLYSISIYHISLFNVYYPCFYIPHHIELYVHLILYTLFIEYNKNNSNDNDVKGDTNDGIKGEKSNVNGNVNGNVKVGIIGDQ